MENTNRIIRPVLAAIASAVLSTSALAVQSQEWLINKEDYFQQLAARIQSLAGNESWQATLHYADRIRGWDGSVLVRIVRLQHRTQKTTVLGKEMPVSFSFTLAEIRETANSDAPPSLKADIPPGDFDLCLGADATHYWFASPGTWNAPDKWQQLIGQIRQTCVVPEPRGGLLHRRRSARTSPRRDLPRPPAAAWLVVYSSRRDHARCPTFSP